MSGAYDDVSRPRHYVSHPSGIECIEVVQHMDFVTGNVVKYLWRVGLKGDSLADQLQDLRKARWYLDRKIALLEQEQAREQGAA